MNMQSSRFLTALILSPFVAMNIARAADPLGLYVGAAVGRADIRAQLTGEVQVVPGQLSPQELGQVDDTQAGFEVVLGARPLSFLGAEVSYIDFGRQSWPPQEVLANGTMRSGAASQKGEAAFAMLYLPVPVIDIYLKAGVSRITTDINANVSGASGFYFCAIGVPFCAPGTASLDETDTSFAAGGGLQWKLGNWALRSEYERFSAAGARPSLISVGVTWSLP